MNAPAGSEIRILLVDDQPLIRTGFSTILETEPDMTVVGQAADGAQAVDLVAQLDPDVVCMDVQMPVMDGIEATRRIRDSGARAAVLILTTFDRDDFLFDTLQAGASGFLLKTAEAEELISAVRTLAEGDGLLAPEVTTRVLQRFVTGAHTEQEQAEPAPLSQPGLPELPRTWDLLTAREREILQWVARGYSNANIAAELVIGEATVKTHVSNTFMKLGVKDRIHAVIWAYEHRILER